jgi:hypothetical protein
MPSFHQPVDNESMHLCWLFTPENRRNCGHASRYLHKVAQDAISKHLTYITLDDVSSNHRQEHNIYKKFGFRYIDNIGAEMIARASTVSRKTRCIL